MDRFRQTGWPGKLRSYQVKVLEQLEAEWARGRRRAWVVLPPGAGKTLVGLEAARRLGRQMVVFVPNTAIQNQWIGHWEHFAPATATAGADRSLDADVTVLTYQSLAVFDPDEEIDEEGHDSPLISRLHDNGRKLIATLRAAGALTVVLDECHHLLDVWGRLLAEVLDQLPDARVLGLTGTPPESLTPAEATLVDTLFGTPLLGASIPALVRQGHLAPFAELVWLTSPTAVESSYIAGEAERFAELTTDLTDPSFGFLSWLDARFVARTFTARSAATTGPADEAPHDGAPHDGLSWARLEIDSPLLAAAALRLHHAGLIDLPPGARLREEHRHAPSAEDWVELLDDYLKHGLRHGDDPGDARALEAIRRALPAVGYNMTRRGIRAARSPVDRVLARGAAKTYGAVEIAAAEADSLGNRLRCLVLCDHERAGARLPARLRDVLDEESGSAWLVLENLVGDPRTGPLAPMLVTGRTVAAGSEAAKGFAVWAERQADGDLDLQVADDGAVAVISGSWSTRTWVALVTAYFEEGHCRVLVGTRGLLGEGWDARGVNTLIDLTTVTTATAVVQTRGRALRLDPTWPDKAANTWTVVCVTDQHPKGAADWDRFVHKHTGYLVAAPDGEIVSGVAHVDAALSPYAPPPVSVFDTINVAMLRRAVDRPGTRAAWRLGTPFRDELVHTLRIRTARAPVLARTATSGSPEPVAVVPAEDCAQPRPRRRRAGRMRRIAAGLGIALLGLIALGGKPGIAATVTLLIAGGWGVRRFWSVIRAARLLNTACGDPPTIRFAYVVADALQAAKLSPRGAEGVVVRPEPDGSYGFALHGVDAVVSERFALALDEVISPMAAPRYVIPRYILQPRAGSAGRRRARDWLRGDAIPDGVVYHAVPGIFGQNRKRTKMFATAWHRWISGGTPVYTVTPEGEGVLATHRGEDPLSATTVLRVAWD